MTREIDAVRFGPVGQADIFLGFVNNGNVKTNMAMSWTRLMMALKHRVTVVPMFSGPNVSQPRNDLVEAFLQTGCDHMLFVDSDIEFMPDDVDALLADDKDIVGAHYLNKYTDIEEPTPVASIPLGDGKFGRATPENLKQTTGLVEVAGLGMGFTLIKREVLEDLQVGCLWPFAEVAVTGEALGEPVDSVDKDTAHLISEDITFCFRARQRGYLSYLDLDVKVGHHKSTVYR